MIKKVLSIKHVGRFKSYGNGQNDALAFEKNTFIFGSNTHGKSTFTAILRSLATQQADFVIGRKTFGATDDQEVCLELDSNAKVQFKDTVWSANLKLAIFDNRYISENIFAGEEINDDKQTKITSVILGVDGQRLENAYQEAAQKCNENVEARKKITNNYKQTHENLYIEFEKFRNLQENSEIDEKIAAKTKEIEVFQNQEKICSELDKLAQKIQQYKSKDFKADLDTTLEIQQDKVKEHIVKHLSQEDGATRFFEQGLSYLHDKEGNNERHCPFCSQKLGVEAEALIDAYNSFFSQEYKDLLSKLRSAKVFFKDWGVGTFLTERVAELEKLGVTLDIASERDEVQKNRKTFDEQLDKKTDLNYKINFHSLDAMTTQIDAISVKVENLKKNHCTLRDDAKFKKLQEEKRELDIRKKRFESPYKETCDEYKKLEQGFKKTLKPNEEKCFKEKVEYAKSIFEEYEQSINELLKKLGADFCLVDLKPNERRRGAQKLFCLQFFDDVLAKVELDGAEHETNFKNTLSDSDKRMLAFAFFMAQLKNKENLSDVIVVMDDPMSSFDLNRKTHTIKLLRDELKGKNNSPVNQLIILTHEENFFKLTHEYFKEGSKYLRIRYKNADNTSEFVDCDINEEFLKEEYFKEIERLKTAIHANDDDITTGDLDLVRKCLEHVMKRKYFVILETEIKQNKSISEFVNKLKNAGIYNDEMERKIQDLLPHNSHHDQSNSNSVSELEPSEIRDIIKNFFETLKTI